MLNKLRGLIVNEEGQGMTEYGLVLGIIGIGAIAALVALREQIATFLEDIKDNLADKTPTLTEEGGTR